MRKNPTSNCQINCALALTFEKSDILALIAQLVRINKRLN